ncbi:MAG: hypothetical protein IKE37_07630, partial [Firmicutes bacterium]|nr:hypothetical protein [Bacillota bacterium]
MKKRMKRFAGILLALLLLISVAGASSAPVYAGGDGEDEPGIIWQTSDLWLLPGSIAYPAIY